MFLTLARVAVWHSLSISDTDDHLLALGERRGTRLVDPTTSENLAWLDTGHTEVVRFRPGGRGLVTSGVTGLLYWPVEVRDVGGVRHRVVGPARTLYQNTPTSDACRVAWDLGGHFLAWTDRPRGEVIIEDVDGTSARRVISGIPMLRDLAISPDGRWLVTCPWRGTAIEVRDLNDGRLAWKHEGDLGRALFSPDGRLLATAINDKVQLWEVGSWLPLRELPCSSAGTMAFSHDGSMLAVNSSGGVVLLVDPASGEPIARLENPDSRIDPFHLDFNSDGSLLAMANGSRGVQLWDLRQIRQTLREVNLTWVWPGSSKAERSTASGTIELHDPRADALTVEHEGHWSAAIPMRNALIAAHPADHGAMASKSPPLRTARPLERGVRRLCRGRRERKG